MDSPRHRISVLIAEDDDDDFLLTQMAFSEAGFDGPLLRVRDGAELMDVLRGRQAHEGPAGGRLLVLLDLNMPRKDGRVALAELKSLPGLRRVPVIVLTTSDADVDVASSYDLGANSFIKKPPRFEDFVELMRVVRRYWCETVALPDPDGAASPR